MLLILLDNRRSSIKVDSPSFEWNIGYKKLASIDCDAKVPERRRLREAGETHDLIPPLLLMFSSTFS